MADVIPMSLKTAKQLVMNMNANLEAYDDIESMCCVKMDKEGEMYIAFNAMSSERMVYLATKLFQFASTF